MEPLLTPPHGPVGIELFDVSRTFGLDIQALAPISASILPGEFVAILGPSGCGKSTLLRLIAGLDAPTSGEVRLSEPAGRAGTAYVFQDAHLLPWRDVLSNVILPLELLKVPFRTRRERAVEALAQVDLVDALSRYPAQLSGGMRMRVSLARALVTRPRLLLLDEPFAALDEITRQRLDEQLRQLWAAHQMTVIFVTHSTVEAVFLADRAIVMSKRPGRIVLDERVDLPPKRAGSIRATPEFARQTQAIYHALEDGGMT